MLDMLKDESQLSKLVAAILAIILMFLAASGRLVDRLITVYLADGH